MEDSFSQSHETLKRTLVHLGMSGEGGDLVTVDMNEETRTFRLDEYVNIHCISNTDWQVESDTAQALYFTFRDALACALADIVCHRVRLAVLDYLEEGSLDA